MLLLLGICDTFPHSGFQYVALCCAQLLEKMCNGRDCGVDQQWGDSRCKLFVRSLVVLHTNMLCLCICQCTKLLHR